VKLSVLFPETRDVGRVTELAQQSEDLGFHGMFLGSAFGFDPVMALAIAGTRTERILLGTAVVPTWPRHPIVMAQQAATANAAAGGRFRLGVGPSHVPVMGMYGIPFDKPIRHLTEYLTILRALLDDGRVKFAGAQYQVTAFLDVEGGGRPPVMLSALHEQMSRLAGRLADGVLPWLAPLSWVADVIIPNVRAGAAEAGRPAPPVIAELPCVLSTDRDHVREVAQRDLAIYPRAAFYADVLAKAGIPGADVCQTEGWSDAMIDAVVPWGDGDALAARVQAYLDAGCDEVVLSPYGGGEKTLEVLGDIARS
jgi:F420-dependent oxidoreductase-like protein